MISIRFFYRYFSLVDDLVSYLCLIGQNKSRIPQLLIIDGLDFYVRQLQVTGDVTVILLHPFINFCYSGGGLGSYCKYKD